MTEAISLRKIFGDYLEKLGGKNKNLIVLDSDLSNSLYSLNFAKLYPERHFTIGEGENSMLSMAAGLTVRGKLPFVCGETAQLINKGLDSLKNSIGYPNLNIKVIGSNSGITNSEDGATRSSLNDLAILNTLPNFKILTPLDSVELKAMLDFMASDFGPTFLRLPKIPLANIYDQNFTFRLGEPDIIQKGDRITIFSYGHLLHETLKTYSELSSRGITAQIINVSSFKPLNEEKIAELCRFSDLVFVIEDHLLSGGLGTQIIEIMNRVVDGRAPKIIKIALESCPESVSHYEDALNKAGLSSKAIYEKIRESWVNV